MSIWNVLPSASPLLILLSVRTAPTLAYLLLSREVSLRARVVGSSVVVVLMLATTVLFGPVVIYALGGLGYYALVTWGLHALIPYVRSRRVTPGGLFALSAALFLFVPALALPHVASGSFLVMGFGGALSAYSYCIENSTRRESSSLRRCLFFVLVDPTLSWVHRSRHLGRPRWNAGGIARALLGVGGLVVAITFLAEAIELLRPLEHELSTDLGLMGRLFLFAALYFLTEYVKQASLASFQIGVMRQLGYATPEAYRYPLLASSPLEFWRRWNLFFGNWLRRYVYTPAALRFGRSFRTLSPTYAKGVGIVAAFGASGLLHAAYVYVESFRVSAGWLIWFGFHAGLVIAWFALGTLGARVLAATAVVTDKPLAAPLFGRLCFLCALVFSVMTGFS